ncbi:MAG: ABC transporter permease [Chloroflexota bacterium]|nr:ABC transporter permease [Chloroflexota bacterium]
MAEAAKRVTVKGVADPGKAVGQTRPRRPPLWRMFIKSDPIAVGAVLVVMLIVLIALAAPVLPLAAPNETSLGERLVPPFQGEHLLGTDHLGRDLLSRLIWGARVSLVLGIIAAVIASTAGALAGIVAGYFGGTVDQLIMRVIDIMLAFPYVLLAIALVAALGPGLFNAMIAIAVVNISFYARNIRGSVLTLRNQGYVEAARAAGATDASILARHILPNVVAPMLVLISMNVGWMIAETAGLSFLGLGAQPPRADWGSMLADGRQFITVAYHVATIPGVAILVLVLTLNIIGDSLRDLLDPRMRGR